MKGLTKKYIAELYEIDKYGEEHSSVDIQHNVDTSALSWKFKMLFAYCQNAKSNYASVRLTLGEADYLIWLINKRQMEKK